MTIEAYVENGQIVLPGALALPNGTKVSVSVKDEQVADSKEPGTTDHEWKPRTALGQRLKALREEFIESGGKLLTADEIEAEVRERRGETFAEQ